MLGNAKYMNRSKASMPKPIDFSAHFYFLLIYKNLAPSQKDNDLSIGTKLCSDFIYNVCALNGKYSSLI